MKALAVRPGTPGIHLARRPEPSIQHDNEVKLRVLRVGICGTDREEVAGERALLPAGQADLVIGHEMFGQVVDVGSRVARVKPGDHAVFTVRRPCGKCLPCQANRPDMCRTGQYTERGIRGRDGYQTEFVVDTEDWVVGVPEALLSTGVLAEPLSVVEKAIDESVRIQFSRLPDAQITPLWLYGRRCLVTGLGPIGLLAAMVLRLQGAEVYGLDVVDAGTPRPRWLEHIGGHYVDGRQVKPDKVDDHIGPVDLIVEATGVAGLAFNILDALAPDGIIALTGIPGGNRCIEIPGAQLVRDLVLDNQLMFGSVNAARDHFQMAVNDLDLAHKRWGDHVAQLITHRYKPEEYETSFGKHPPEVIKAVVEWNS